MMRVATTWVRKLSPTLMRVEWRTGEATRRRGKMLSKRVRASVGGLSGGVDGEASAAAGSSDGSGGGGTNAAGGEKTAPGSSRRQGSSRRGLTLPRMSTPKRTSIMNQAEWQPLFFHDPDDWRQFNLELRWPDTTLHATLGTLHVKMGDDLEQQSPCQSTLELLHATAPMLQVGMRARVPSQGLACVCTPLRRVLQIESAWRQVLCEFPPSASAGPADPAGPAGPACAPFCDRPASASPHRRPHLRASGRVLAGCGGGARADADRRACASCLGRPADLPI